MTSPPSSSVAASSDLSASGPDTTLHTINYVVQALTIVVVSCFVAVRIYAKHKVFGGALSLDDIATYSSFTLLIGYCITFFFAGLHGAGLDQTYVDKAQVQRFLQTGYAATLLYAPMAMTAKLALLIIIIRVFGSVHRKTLIGVYLLIGVIVAYYVSGWFIKLFICMPISSYWKGHAEHCLNQGAIITADAIISVVSDMVILLLPTPLTWSLQLSKRKRIRVSGLLCAGGVATAFGIYRLALVLKEGNSSNQTVVFTKVVLSGNAEVGIGLICACLPAINALWTEKTKNSSYYRQKRSTPSEPHRGEIMMTRTFHVNTSSLSKEADDGTAASTTDWDHDDVGLVSSIRAAPSPQPSHQADLLA